MIQSIQLQEATLFLEAKQHQLKHGKDDEYQTKIAKWLSVNELMESLGIKSDLLLLESRQTSDLIYQIWQERKEI